VTNILLLIGTVKPFENIVFSSFVLAVNVWCWVDSLYNKLSSVWQDVIS